MERDPPDDGDVWLSLTPFRAFAICLVDVKGYLVTHGSWIIFVLFGCEIMCPSVPPAIFCSVLTFTTLASNYP